MSNAVNSKREITGDDSGSGDIVQSVATSAVVRVRSITHPWTLVLAVIVIVFLSVLLSRFELSDETSITGFSTTNASITFAPVKSFPVEIVGSQFKWYFKYPGPDGILDTADDQLSENNELFLPTNCTVTVRLNSDDYIYIFAVPATKKDLSAKMHLNSQAKSGSETHFVSSSARTKQRCPAIPRHPAAMLLRTMGEDQIPLLVSPGCGFRLIHDPVMGKIIVTDQYDYRRLLPAAVGFE